jgi:hypothetical protein
MKSLLALLVLGSTTLAHAQPDTAAPLPAPAHPAAKRVTIMWAPLRLIVPLVEFTAEVRVRDHLGVSITAGAGKRSIESGGTKVSGTELEGGAQVRYYILKAFSGLHVGGEVLDEYVKFDEPLPMNIAAVAAGGVTVGPFAGYKLVTHAGFSFEAQLGARYLVVDPHVTGMATGAPPIDKRWMPLLHLNAGWSF